MNPLPYASFPLLPLAMALLLSACSLSPTVTRSHDPVRLGPTASAESSIIGQSYTLEVLETPGTSWDRSRTLDVIHAHLQRHGFQTRETPHQADLRVGLRVQRQKHEILEYRYERQDDDHRFGRPRFWFFQPVVRIPHRYNVYDKRLTITITDNQQDQQATEYFRGVATIRQRRSSFQGLSPCLAAVLLRDFPGKRSETTRVSIDKEACH